MDVSRPGATVVVYVVALESDRVRDLGGAGQYMPPSFGISQLHAARARSSPSRSLGDDSGSSRVPDNTPVLSAAFVSCRR